MAVPLALCALMGVLKNTTAARMTMTRLTQLPIEWVTGDTRIQHGHGATSSDLGGIRCKRNGACGSIAPVCTQERILKERCTYLPVVTSINRLSWPLHVTPPPALAADPSCA
eukprot:365990-Chlamydomonas_euryale.AAC.27